MITLPEYVLSAAVVASSTIFLYWQFLGKSHERKREDLERKLKQALRTVSDLEEKLLSLEHHDLKKEGKEIRIWMDGAFDMMHFGHMNAFRQGKALGSYLIVGVNSDETITACKGKPVCSEIERLETVRACKWVDEVVEGVPYIMSDEYLAYVIEKYNIDYVVHGDDPCIVDGKDVYESARKMGKYLTIPRTEGISTTDLVGRMLLMTRAHHAKIGTSESFDIKQDQGFELVSRQDNWEKEGSILNQPFQRKSRFLTTSRIIRLFGAGFKAPEPGAKIVYVVGAWDMFNARHIDTLIQAKSVGDYVIAGVHGDHEVNQRRGGNQPIMSLNERVLSLLGCKWVDDVLIDAPFKISQDMISALRISFVIVSITSESTEEKQEKDEINSSSTRGSGQPRSYSIGEIENKEIDIEDDMFEIPRKLGILRYIKSKYTTDVLDFVERVHTQRDKFTAK